jgi:hypothetical protein
MRDIFQVQTLIGGELVPRVTVTAPESSLAELQALHNELIAAATRPDDVLLEERNHALHRGINLLAGSRKIIWGDGPCLPLRAPRFHSNIQGWPWATADDHSKLL